MTYPIGTHLDNVRLPIFVFAEGFMPGTATNSITVLEDSKVMHGSICQCLLRMVRSCFLKTK
jgi:hypothetical protein